MNQIKLSGTSVHSGIESTLTFTPTSDPSHTIVFNDQTKFCIGSTSFSDLKSNRATEVVIDKNHSINTIEHLSAALALFKGQGLSISLIGSEIPIFDGSALPIFKALSKLYTPSTQIAEYQCPLVWSHTWNNESMDGFIQVKPANAFSVRYILESDALQQEFIFHSSDNVSSEIIPARTYISQKELKYCATNNVLQGVKEGMGIVYSQTPDPLSPTIESGAPLRYNNEFVRHKILDFIGDLFLIHQELPTLEITIKNGGHWITHELIKRIIATCHF